MRPQRTAGSSAELSEVPDPAASLELDPSVLFSYLAFMPCPILSTDFKVRSAIPTNNVSEREGPFNQEVDKQTAENRANIVMKIRHRLAVFADA